MLTDFLLDIGDVVLCDFCNEDYSDSDECGGALFGSWAVCPKCLAPDSDYSVRAHSGETFKDFVLRWRDHSYVGVTEWD